MHMIEKIALFLLAILFTYATGSALRERRFQYRFGPVVERSRSPREYWIVVTLFSLTTAIIWIIALGVTWRVLSKYSPPPTP